MYTATSGALVAQAAVDTIANNLANVNTAGFKQTLLQIQAQPQIDLYRIQTDPGQLPNARTPGVPTQVPIGSLGSGAQIYDTPSDLQQGGLSTTGNDLDVALSGPGFFAIQAGDGTRAYTRDGSFGRDANGYLVASNGDQVLGTDGNPILLPDTGKVGISRDGTVTVMPQGVGQTNAAQTVGQLQIVEFGNANALRPQGAARFIDTGAAAPAAATQTTALQGSLETSNANVITSMIGLITNERWFDMNIQMITAQDSTTGQAIQSVGRSTPT
jgi:flagellar basal-body rod protein FlgF